MQQVNLYQPIFKQQEKVFSAKTLLQAGTVVVGGLMAFYGFALWQTADLDERVRAFEGQHQEALKRLERVSRQFPAPKEDPALVRKLEKRKAELGAKQRVVTVLDAPDFGNVSGFTEQLEAFARQRPNNLWLRQVTIRKGGSSVTLVGSTYEPEQVPQMVQRLGKERSLSGTEFRRLRMSRSEADPQRVDFTLHTDPDEGEQSGGNR